MRHLKLINALVSLFAVFGFSRADTAAPNHAPIIAVRWNAPFLSGGGYCTEATDIVQGLDIHGVAVEMRQHGDGFSQTYVDGLSRGRASLIKRLMRTTALDSDSIAVCHSEPGAWHLPESNFPQRWSTSVCPHPDAAFKVGRTMFETDRLPSGWADRINAMDEVWVPTAWSRDVFAAGGVDPAKLAIVPEAVDTEIFTPQAAPSRLLPQRDCASLGTGIHLQPGSSSACPYRFLFVGKWERRKGLDILFRSFFSEFGPRSSTGRASTPEQLPFVELFILTSAYHSDADLGTAVHELIDSQLTCLPGTSAADVQKSSCILPGYRSDSVAHRVHLLHDIPAEQLPGIYTGVDALVLPSRGEGWGRPLVEAMAAGLPVIATNWSGPTAFLTDQTGYPLAVAGFSPIPDGAFAGHLQAEPDTAHLRSLMRSLVQDPRAGRATGARARASMLAHFTPRLVAEKVIARLEEITARVLQRRSLSAGLKRLKSARDAWVTVNGELAHELVASDTEL